MCPSNTLSKNNYKTTIGPFPVCFSKPKVINIQVCDEVTIESKKNVRFSDHNDTFFVTTGGEDRDNAWYNQSDLLNFRNTALTEAKILRLNKNHPDKNLHEAHDAAKRGNLANAFRSLTFWCSFTSEHACARGIENILKNRIPQEATKTVMMLQSELRKKSSKGCCSEKGNAEIIREVYEKASVSCKYFALAMGVADSMVVNDKLKSRRRRISREA